MKSPYLCPHFQNIDKLHFLQIFTKASSIRGEDENLFYFTHYPIDLYDKNEEVESILETEVLMELQRERIGNFVVAIEGETGTGKSELCVYLSYELKKLGMKVLLIDKNSDLMSILADDLPDFYFKHTGKKINRLDNLKHFQKQLKKNIKLISVNIGTRAINNLTKIYSDLIVDPDNPRVKQFIKLLESKLLQLISRGDEEYPSEMNFISAEDLKSGNRNINFGIPGNVSSISDDLNQSIWDAVKDEQQIPTIDKMIEEINRDINERFTIIFEDFSITSLDKKKLQNYLERDKITDKVNFIIAGLANKLESLYTPTAVDRVNERTKFYKTSKSGESRTLFLTEENCINFIRPYISYYKALEGSIEFKRDKKGRITDTIYKSGDNKCNRCGKCLKELRDIFPFNKTFLKRIYKGLKVEDQKPRKYVETIGLILDEYIDFRRSPSSATRLLLLSKDLIIPQSIVNLNDERLNHFLRWYADEFDDSIKFSSTYADLLGIDYSKINNHQILGDSVIISKLGNEINELGEAELVKGKEEFIPEWKKQFNEQRGYISGWKMDPYNKDWFQLNTYLIDVISDIFKEISSSYKISLNSPINIRIGKNENIFTFNNLQFDEKIEMFQISLNSEDFTEQELSFLLRQAIYKGHKHKDFSMDEILKKTPYAIIEGFIKWQSKCQNYIFNFNFFKKDYHRRNYGYIDIAFLYCVLSYMIVHPWNRLSFIDFDLIYYDFKDFLLEEKIVKTIPEYLIKVLETQTDLKNIFSNFLICANYARQISLHFFRLNNPKTLNYRLLKSYLKKNQKSLTNIIDGIKSKGTIRTFYKEGYSSNPNRIKVTFQKNQLELKDFFESIVTFGNFLQDNELFMKIDLPGIKNAINLIESCIENVDFNTLKTIFQELSVYPPGTVNKYLLIYLKRLIKKSKFIEEFIRGKNFLKKLILDYPQSILLYDKTHKLRVSLAYYHLLNYEGILDLIKKIDALILLRKTETLDISELLNLVGYLE